jgi:3-hydroxyacyl-CoA dehydrogenase
MNEINTIAVLGANGTMGSLSGGIFAQAGIRCFYFARSIEKANRGIENAVKQARSDVLREYIVPRTYESLTEELPQCDWIVEAVAEDLDLKRQYYQTIDAHRKKGSIVSTVSSGLSIEQMARDCSEDFKAHFMGVHFFNPPGKLPANEITFHSRNSENIKKYVFNFCEKVLQRVNIVTYDKPGFAGNRIGFQFLNGAARAAERYGVEMTDYLLGPFTGRALPPLATIDLVGLDVHRAIVDNIYEQINDELHETFLLPGYVQRMIDKKLLGRKSAHSGGFYRFNEKKEKLCIDPASLEHRSLENIKIDPIERIKLHIHDGEYQEAVHLLKHDDSEPLALVRQFILNYITYSYARVGEVSPPEEGIHGIDRVMSYGFSWLPPSAWVDFLGGPEETIKLLEGKGIAVPEQLSQADRGKQCRIPEVTRFFIAY